MPHKATGYGHEGAQLGDAEGHGRCKHAHEDVA